MSSLTVMLNSSEAGGGIFHTFFSSLETGSMANHLFDDFISFGRRVMDGVNRGEKESIRYKRLLGEITALLEDTHSMVVRRLERLERAASAAEAWSILAELRAEPLEAAFRAEGLCDAFAGLGNALDRVNWETRGDAAMPFTDDEMQAVGNLAQTLVAREGEVAMGYTMEIQHLLQSLYEDEPTDLGELHARAAKARRTLTDQIADFDALTTRFRKLETT
jgi:hypothetical protein